MALQIMWWGSLHQTLSADLFLALRKSNVLHSAKFFRRLDIDESSTGENAAFVDSWIRTSSQDYESLQSWCLKSKGNGVVVWDLWGPLLNGVDVSSYSQQLLEVAQTVRLLVVLMPRVKFGLWCDELRDYDLPGLTPEGRRLIKARMLNAKATYEWFLNAKVPISVVESSVTQKDFEEALGLDFQQSQKLWGLVHLVPRDVVALSGLGFSDRSALTAALQRLLEGRTTSDAFHVEREFLHLSLPTGTAGRLEGLMPRNSRASGDSSLPSRMFHRRRDGALALTSGWPLFLRTLSKRTAAGRVLPMITDGGARQFLIFLMHCEARQSLRMGLGMGRGARAQSQGESQRAEGESGQLATSGNRAAVTVTQKVYPAPGA